MRNVELYLEQKWEFPTIAVQLFFGFMSFRVLSWDSGYIIHERCFIAHTKTDLPFFIHTDKMIMKIPVLTLAGVCKQRGNDFDNNIQRYLQKN